ncbi:hypothetical protein ACWEPC_07855 [Nonomuraea sp. NPDC004297]
MKKHLHRAFATAAASALLFGGISLVTATPASAKQAHCVRFLKSRGYDPSVDYTRYDACSAGAKFVGWQRCLVGLASTGVPRAVTLEACRQARRK